MTTTSTSARMNAHASTQGYVYPDVPPGTPRPASNHLGIAGFIVSLVGLVATCGALSPVGLLLSGVALFKRPRGFALAGTVLGLVGTAFIGTLVASGLAFSALVGSEVARQRDMADSAKAEIQIAGLAEHVGLYHQAMGRPPSSLEILPAIDESQRTDPWGRGLVYEPDERGFTIRSAGADGTIATSDDVWQAWDFASTGVTPRPLPSGLSPDTWREWNRGVESGATDRMLPQHVDPLPTTTEPAEPDEPAERDETAEPVAPDEPAQPAAPGPPSTPV